MKGPIRPHGLGRKVVGVFAALALTALGLLGFSGTASADFSYRQVAEDCKTVVSTLTDRPDSGNHGTWALDSVTRTVTVCHVAEVLEKSAVVIETWKYHAKVEDEGTFVTVAGSSPNKGHPVKGGVKGYLTGSFTADFTAPHDWIGWDDSKLAGKTLTGVANPTTSLWVKALWKDGFAGSSINDDWTWSYWTCNATRARCTEKWLDNAKTNGGGPHDGDIVGKPCPSPSASPTPEGSGSSAVIPVDNGQPSLPVTGPAVPGVVVGGLALLTLGGIGVWFARKRRVRFTA